MIPTDTTLIIMEENLKVGFIFDAMNLSMLFNPAFKFDETDTTKINEDIIYSVAAVSHDWKYLILDVSYLQKIVILNTKDLSVIQTIQYHLKYVILDIDIANRLICTLSIDSLILIY